MSKVAVITLAQLVRIDACEEQRDLFREIWGDQVVVTEGEFVKHAEKFDWNFGTDYMLADSPGNYQQTRDRRLEARALFRQLQERPEHAEAQTAIDLARENRDRAENEAGPGYVAARAAWEKYTPALDEAIAKKAKLTCEDRARAFARCYIKYQSKEIEDGTANAADPVIASSSNAEVEVPRADGNPGNDAEDVGVGHQGGVGDTDNPLDGVDSSRNDSSADAAGGDSGRDAMPQG
jgi:hypothetical protein